MKRLLVVVDFQNDFVDGVLGFPKAKELYPEVLRLILAALNRKDDIVFTRDAHDENYLETEEGKNLPVPHCLKGSHGYLFYGALERIAKCKNAIKVYEKDTFGCAKLGEHLLNNAYDAIDLIGLDLSICVSANAIIAKTYNPNAHVSVLLSASASGDPDAEMHAVMALRRLQIDVR